MSVRKRPNIDLLEFKGSFSGSFEDSVIEEALHTFKNQYEVASLLSQKAVECIKYNYEGTTVDVSNFQLPITKVSIQINKNSLYPAIGANISQVQEDGSISITINTGSQMLVYFTENQLKDEIKNAIAHELEHAYTVLNTYHNTGKADSISTNALYRDVYNIIHNAPATNDVYYIAYATYSTFGHELNAFVSQCYGEVYNFLKQLGTITNNDIRNALKSSQVYNIFNTNIENVNAVLAYNDQNKTNFINRFNGSLQNPSNKLKDVNGLNKLLKSVLNRNMIAVKNCQRTAMQAYYNLTQATKQNTNNYA